MRSGQHWLCRDCDMHRMGGSISTDAPVEQWPKCELCGKPTLLMFSTQERDAIAELRKLRAENDALRSLVRLLMRAVRNLQPRGTVLAPDGNAGRAFAEAHRLGVVEE